MSTFSSILSKNNWLELVSTVWIWSETMSRRKWRDVTNVMSTNKDQTLLIDDFFDLLLFEQISFKFTVPTFSWHPEQIGCFFHTRGHFDRTHGCCKPWTCDFAETQPLRRCIQRESETSYAENCKGTANLHEIFKSVVLRKISLVQVGTTHSEPFMFPMHSFILQTLIPSMPSSFLTRYLYLFFCSSPFVIIFVWWTLLLDRYVCRLFFLLDQMQMQMHVFSSPLEISSTSYFFYKHT